MNYQRFIDILIAQQVLWQSDLDRVNRERNQESAEGLPKLLITLGLCSEQNVAQALAEASNLEVARSYEYPEESPLGDEISVRFLKEYHIAGLAASERNITLAVLDPEDDFIQHSLHLITTKKVIIKVGVLSDIDNALDLQYGDSALSRLDHLAQFYLGDTTKDEPAIQQKHANPLRSK